jgi:hypothetical protein
MSQKQQQQQQQLSIATTTPRVHTEVQLTEAQRVPPSQEYAHYLSKRTHAFDKYREKSNERRQKFRKLFEDAIYKDTTTYQLNL